MGLLDKFRKKNKALTQEGRVLRELKNAGSRGVENWRLSHLALKYTSVVSDLRKEGHNILAIRQPLANGKMSNTWKYYLNEEES